MTFLSTPPQSPRETAVLVVGAGIGGLMTAILLERAQIPYLVLEKSATIRPLGSAISINQTVQPLLEQLGLLGEIELISKPICDLSFLSSKTTTTAAYVSGEQSQEPKPIGSLIMNNFSIERYGYENLVMSRPELYKILMSRVPSHKVIFNKRVETVQDSGETLAVVTCADGTVYQTQIVIGADGAASRVRTQLYEQLEARERNSVPKSDLEPLKFSQHCIVGVTKELSDLDAEELGRGVSREEFCSFKMVLSEDSPYSWWTMPLANNAIAWMVYYNLDQPDTRLDSTSTTSTTTISSSVSADDQQQRHSDWGPEAAETMCSQVRHFTSPYRNNKTLGDFIDRTPREYISKVMLEEKFFETWFGQRVMLIGDACHKVVPYAGQGAVQAIHDAVSLVNLLVQHPQCLVQCSTVISTTSTICATATTALESIFRQHYKDRSPIARQAVKDSALLSFIFGQQTMMAKISRQLFLNCIPLWFKKKMTDVSYFSRPQAVFIPFVPPRGCAKMKGQTQHWSSSELVGGERGSRDDSFVFEEEAMRVMMAMVTAEAENAEENTLSEKAPETRTAMVTGESLEEYVDVREQ